MKINLIVGISENGIIGKNNSLPWSPEKYKEDLQFFKKMTTSNPGKDVVIMGSKTMHSINRKLPGRRNLVISRTLDLFRRAETGIETYRSLSEAISNCSEDEVVWLIGGGAIYREGIYLADRLFITEIPEIITGEDLAVSFPFIHPRRWKLEETITLSVEKKLSCYVYQRIGTEIL